MTESLNAQRYFQNNVSTLEFAASYHLPREVKRDESAHRSGNVGWIKNIFSLEADINLGEVSSINAATVYFLTFICPAVSAGAVGTAGAAWPLDVVRLDG